jgi:hypothetical protein
MYASLYETGMKVEKNRKRKEAKKETSQRLLHRN